MNYKVCLVILGTLLAVQASNQSPVEGSTKDAIVTVLEEILALLKTGLEEASAAVDDLDTNSAEIEAKIVARVVAAAKKINAKLVNLLNELSETASDGGKAVLECFIAEEDPVDAALETGITDFGTCMSNDTSLVIDALREGLTQLTQLVTDIQEPVDTLSSCTLADSICLLSFATAEIEILQKIPEVVKEDIAELKQLYDTLSGDAKECAQSVVTDFKSDLQLIVESTSDCVLKINSN